MNSVITTDCVGSALKPLLLVQLPVVSRFDSRDHFAYGNNIPLYMKEFFREFFVGKIEEAVSACELKVQMLIKQCSDRDILTEIGTGNEETKLAHVFELLKRQSEGREGALLVNGRANVFYVKDKHSSLHAVSANWNGELWLVRAHDFKEDLGWETGHRIFSR